MRASKARFVTTLKPETIKYLRIKAAKEEKNINEIIEELVEKDKKED